MQTDQSQQPQSESHDETEHGDQDDHLCPRCGEPMLETAGDVNDQFSGWYCTRCMIADRHA